FLINSSMPFSFTLRRVRTIFAHAVYYSMRKALLARIPGPWDKSRGNSAWSPAVTAAPRKDKPAFCPTQWRKSGLAGHEILPDQIAIVQNHLLFFIWRSIPGTHAVFKGPGHSRAVLPGFHAVLRQRLPASAGIMHLRHFPLKPANAQRA